MPAMLMLSPASSNHRETTSKAAERYFGLADDNMIRNVYSDTNNVIQLDTKLILKKGLGQNNKQL